MSLRTTTTLRRVITTPSSSTSTTATATLTLSSSLLRIGSTSSTFSSNVLSLCNATDQSRFVRNINTSLSRVNNITRSFATTRAPNANANASTPPSGNAKFIQEVNDQNLGAVVNSSAQVPLLLFCYSSADAASLEMKSITERLVTRANGKVRLGVLDCGAHPMAAQSIRIRTLPTLLGIVGNKPIASSEQVMNEKEINAFIRKVAGEDEDDAAGLLEVAQEHFQQGDIQTARQLYQDVLLQQEQKQHHPLAIAGLIRCSLQEGKTDDAKQLVDTIKNKYKDSVSLPEVAAAVSAFEMANEFKLDGATESSLRQTLQTNPNDHNTRYKLCGVLFSQGRREEAVEEALTIVRRDRKWNEDAARKLLLKMFEVIGTDQELVIKARKRLASYLSLY